MGAGKKAKPRDGTRKLTATTRAMQDEPELVRYVHEKRAQGWTFALICREGNARDKERFPYAVVQRLGKEYDAQYGKPKMIVRTDPGESLGTRPTTIPVRDLRNDSARILREVGTGKRFLITVSGHEVAELAPVASKSVFMPRSVVESIIREAPLDRDFADDIRAALGERVDEL